jgi:hypothetical protein
MENLRAGGVPISERESGEFGKSLISGRNHLCRQWFGEKRCGDARHFSDRIG